jgi:ribosomal protein S18 acetylase RimI-like enzyme
VSPEERALPWFVDDQTGKLALAVLPEFQGHGIGTSSLDALLNEPGAPDSVVLTLRETNRAAALYRRHCFQVTGTTTNRVGTNSYIMLWSRR